MNINAILLALQHSFKLVFPKFHALNVFWHFYFNVFFIVFLVSKKYGIKK